MRNLKSWFKLRFAVLERDGFTCHYCGRAAPSVPLEVDHIIPASQGGTDRMENLVTACWSCNRGRGSFLHVRRLRASPSSPRESNTLSVAIMDLMADGKVRSGVDIALTVRVAPNIVRVRLNGLCHHGKLERVSLRLGRGNSSTWRLASPP